MVAKARRSVSRNESDETLRRNSPAYRPDDDWEVLEPQGMKVVVSVRFDASSARRVAALARESGGTPSGLIRDWTIERLSTLANDRVGSPGVREASAQYRTRGDEFEALRKRYRPGEINFLLVGESRPAGGTFFYRANSNLFYATREAFQTALGPVPAGEAFLEFLRDHGVWLYDLADQPVDRMRGRPRRAAVQERIGELVNLLRETRPAMVIAIKKDLGATVRSALKESEISVERLQVLPFPLYQWRTQYVHGLASLVRGTATDPTSSARGR